MASFEEQFLLNLAAINQALGGSQVELTTPRSFESDSLLMLQAIALAAAGGGAPGGGELASLTPPPSPGNGDRWLEIDAAGYPIERWYWDHTHDLWLSQTIYSWQCATSDRNSQYFGDYVPTQYTHIYSAFPDRDSLFLSFSVSYWLENPCDSSNYWYLYLRALGNASEAEILGGHSTASSTAAGDHHANVPIGIHGLRVETSNRRIGMDLVLTDSAGNPPAIDLWGAVVRYRRIYQ
jgi:hypothetical protein